MDIDELDKKIINFLLLKPKAPVREIGQSIGVSAVTVLNRIKALEKAKIIRHYTAHVDYSLLGYDFEVVVKCRVSKGKMVEVEHKIATQKGVIAVYDITGNFDALIIAKFKSRKGLDAFVKKIQGFNFVERTETNIILNTIKESHLFVE